MKLVGRTTVAGLGVALIAMVSPSTFAQTSSRPAPDAAAVRNGAQPQPTMASTTDECWASWLSTQVLPDGKRLAEGMNQRPENGPLFLAKSEYPVKGTRGTTTWVASRSAAFTQAELGARGAMANYIGTEIRSSRSASIFKSGGDQPPPDLDGAATLLSNAERLNTLTGLALDNAIRQFDPTWNGSGLTDEQKQQQAVKLRGEVVGRVAARSEVFAAGAFTVTQCEGLDADGNYAVLVGMALVHKSASL